MTDAPTPTPPAVDRVTYAVDGGVATITIDAADAGNSLTSSMRDGMTELVEWASADHGVRAIVLTGAGSATSAPAPTWAVRRSRLRPDPRARRTACSATAPG